MCSPGRIAWPITTEALVGLDHLHGRPSIVDLSQLSGSARSRLSIRNRCASEVVLLVAERAFGVSSHTPRTATAAVADRHAYGSVATFSPG